MIVLNKLDPNSLILRLGFRKEKRYAVDEVKIDNLNFYFKSITGISGYVKIKLRQLR